MKELKGIENTLPEKWAIKTDRQEFYDWVNKNNKPFDSEISKAIWDRVIHIPNIHCTNSNWGADHRLREGYELITFERWARVYRPDLVTVTRVTEAELNDEPETPAIPAKWCVRRTSENAEVLKAWLKYKHPDSDVMIDIHFNKSSFVFCEGSHAQTNYGYPEITFEQWQTIPEHAEWIKDYEAHKFIEDAFPAMCEPDRRFTGPMCEKVEKREIIGYEFKKDISEEIKEAAKILCKRHGDWQIYPEGNFVCDSLHHTILKTVGVLELWFNPVYREIEKPVFKVGDTVITKNYSEEYDGKPLTIQRIDDGYFYFRQSTSCNHNFMYEHIERLATPEEIEAARPKRKYMKQRWYVLEWKSGIMSVAEERKFDTKEEASVWVLENAVEGNEYEIKPFEVVAYE